MGFGFRVLAFVLELEFRVDSKVILLGFRVHTSGVRCEVRV